MNVLPFALHRTGLTADREEPRLSFDHLWIGFVVDMADYDRIAPDFHAAAQRAVLTAESRQALAAWGRRPADFDQDAVGSDRPAAEANRFIWAFNLPGFDAFAAEFLTKDGKHVAFAERGFFRLVAAANHTPVSILWSALGSARAGLLPGHMGNMLLPARDVAAAEDRVRRAYEGVAPGAMLAAAQRYCGWRVNDETLKEVIGFLPQGLARARAGGLGFLSLARAQI